MKKSISLFLALQVLFCSFVFSGCSNNPQPATSRDIIYQDKTISLGMSLEEVEALLGKGELVSEEFSKDKKAEQYWNDLIIDTYRVYQYDGLQIKYYLYMGDTTFFVKSFTITTPDIYTFTGIEIGDNAKKIDEKYGDNFVKYENRSTYQIFFSKDDIASPPLKDKDTASIHAYHYDEKNKITEILIYSVDATNLHNQEQAETASQE